MALLPVIFIVHDFEEIIFFKPWLQKNKAEMFRRFPKPAKRIYYYYGSLSTSAFATAVLQIFITVSVCTFLSLYTNSYGLWFGTFIIFFLHIIVHIVQWLTYGKYIPVIISSILSLPYCVYTLFVFLETFNFELTELILWTLLGVIAFAILYVLALHNANVFERWKNKRFFTN